MKFRVIIEVPEEMILNYKQWISKQNEENINFDLEKQKSIELLIKDMIEEQTSWDVKNCELINF